MARRMAKHKRDKKTLGDIVEDTMREKKLRKKIPLAERVRIFGKPWSEQRHLAHKARTKRLKESRDPHETKYN